MPLTARVGQESGSGMPCLSLVSITDITICIQEEVADPGIVLIIAIVVGVAVGVTQANK